METLLAALSAGLGSVCVLAAGAAASYWLLCYFGLHDSANIDVELEHHQSSLLTPQPVLNNVLLLLIFLSLHSLLARSWLKRALSPIVSPSLYRQLYFLISAATLFLVPYGWSPLPRLLWHIDTPVIKYLVYGCGGCGVALTTVAFFSVQPLEFCGLKDSVCTLFGTSRDQGEEGNELIVHGVYGMVRHPMYTGVLILLWSQPSMSQGRLLLAGVLTLYLFLAVPFLEEPTLIQQFGNKYRHYMTTTGMFFPHIWPSQCKKVE